MASRRLFDGAQIELGLLPIVGVSGISGAGSVTLSALTGISAAGLSIFGATNGTLDGLTG